MTATAPPPVYEEPQEQPQATYTPPVQPQPSYTPPVQQQPQATYAPQYPQYNPAPVTNYGEAPPSRGSRYAIMGTGAYLGLLILFCIPIAGWIACIVMAISSKNVNRRNLARAVLILLVIGAVLSVITYFLLSWVIGAILEYLGEYVGEATGGDLGSIKDILAIVK
jgi:hypothetical protein